MDYDKLIERLNTKLQSYVSYTDAEFARAMEDAITAIETLRLESDAQEMQLNEFSEFLCHMTGGLLSKTTYTAQGMINAAEDYQQRVCDNDCELRADLARVTKERDAAIECLKNKCPFCRKYLTCQGRTINNDCWEFFGLKEDWP